MSGSRLKFHDAVTRTSALAAEENPITNAKTAKRRTVVPWEEPLEVRVGLPQVGDKTPILLTIAVSGEDPLEPR